MADKKGVLTRVLAGLSVLVLAVLAFIIQACDPLSPTPSAATIRRLKDGIAA
jgi:hypothetical protein